MTNEKIIQLATEIYYAQGKGVDISADEWIEKLESLLKAQKAELLEEWNCQCEKPKPNGIYSVGEHEGGYQRCKRCDRRIWD